MLYHEGFLVLLVLLVPMALFLWRRYKKGLNDFRLLVGPWRFDELRDAYIFRWFFTSLLIIVYFTAMVLALADIRFPDNPEMEEVPGRDIIFCVDVSRSMNAEDTGESRMGLAREAIAGIIESGHTVRFGIVAFKGTASVFVPVTEDLYTILDSLPYLGPGLLSSKGTNIRSGIEAAVSAFPEMQESRRQLILFTDGEALEGSLDGIDGLLKERRIEFTAVGVGTAGGGTIPAGNDGFVTDLHGDAVITRLDEASLRSAAEAAGGTYRQLDGRGAVHGLVLELASEKGVVYLREKLGFRIFLIPALIAMLLLHIIWSSPWKRES